MRLNHKLTLAAMAIVVGAVAAGQVGPLRVLESRSQYLGRAGAPEWQEFEGRNPDGTELTIRFTAQHNDRECTLFIRQRDVKLNWTVQLNERRLGALHMMEQPLVHVLPVPPGALRDGENTLAIRAPTAIDDVILGEIRLDTRPVMESLRLCTLEVDVSDANVGRALPCRITIVDKQGSLAALFASPEKQLVVRPGVAYSRDGKATLGVLPGDYTIYATRGFEYSVDSRELSIAEGETRNVQLKIRREVPTPKLVSCDTHIHTLTHSGHGDATIDERMITIAGEGIELAVATEHNLHADYSEAAGRMQVHDRFTSVIGNEVTTKKGHFNTFPIKPASAPPDYRLEDWPQLMQSIRSTPGVRVVVLNHPRNVHSDFQPMGPANYNPVTGDNRRGPEFTFDAIEVVTSAALQSDPMLCFRDWFALLNHGYKVAGVGSSDSHDVSRFILGQGRTYVACRDDSVAAIDVDQACDSFLAGRVLVSMGLLTQMTVNNRFHTGDLATGLNDELLVHIVVLGPSWVEADRVELFANGLKVKEQRIDAAAGSVEKAALTWTIPVPAHDVHLVAIASGPGVTAPFWAIPRPYQPTSRAWQPRVLGATNPIWIDADRDGRFSSARAYAQLELDRTAGDSAQLAAALAKYDQAVAAQTASLIHAAGKNVHNADVARIFETAGDRAKRGWGEFIESLSTAGASRPNPSR